MTAIILAGGQASRMEGYDKAFLKIGNQPLIKRQIRVLRKIFKKIIVVTNSPERYKSIKGVKIITDITPHQGPLGGMFSGLAASTDRYNFVVACDMPFINEGLINYMMKSIDNYDIVVPKIEGRPHPLLGIYSQKSLPVIEKMLSRDRLKISNIFSKLRVRFISKRELEKFDKPLLSLENINTVDDLARIKKLQEVKLCQRR